jgi:hypothetical protein
MKYERNFTLLRMGAGLLVSMIALAVYILTLAPTVSFIDGGELTSVCATLGIAHPTGYPVYTLLGRLFLLLPLHSNKAFQLNLLSGLLVSAAVYLLFTLVHDMQTDRLGVGHKDDRKIIPSVLAVSTATALILGFSTTMWSQALVAEVYSLHAFFLLTLLLLLFKATGVIDGEKNANKSMRLYVLFAYLFGLGMANHMTLIVLTPACVYLIISKEGVSKSLIKISTLFLPAFLLGLSSYLYLPIRSAVQPVLDWGNPETVSNFFRHLSGKQYQVWMFSSLDVAARHLSTFAKTLPLQFSPFLFPVALFGVWRLYRRHRRLLWSTCILFGSDLLYSINYDIHDIESYFIPCFIMTAFWIGMGLVHVCDSLRSRGGFFQWGAVGLVLALPLLPFAIHYADVDKNSDYVVHDYTQNLLKGIGQDGIVISRQWDFFCSPLYYFQLVEGFRPDVVLIEQELLRRSWYYPQLQRQYPWLLEASQREVDDFRIELEKFENGRQYDPTTIQRKFIQMIDSFIGKNIDVRPVYITPEVEESVGSGYIKVPEGLTYRLYRDDEFHPFEKPGYTYRGIEGQTYTDYFHQTVISFYSNMLTARGTYLSRYDKCDEAVEYFREALGVEPHHQQAQRGLKRCEVLLQP